MGGKRRSREVQVGRRRSHAKSPLQAPRRPKHAERQSREVQVAGVGRLRLARNPPPSYGELGRSRAKARPRDKSKE